MPAYSKQVMVGGWLLYTLILLLISIGCGFAIGVAESNQTLYQTVIFFTLLAMIVIIIGSFSLTFPI